MEEVVELIQNFVVQEYEVLIKIRTESDVPLIEMKLNALNQFFQGFGFTSDLTISSSRNLEEREAVISQLQSRVLFQIKQYTHSTFGDIFRVYLSSPFRGDNSYFSNFYIAKTDKGLKIISRYNICSNCNGQGNRSGLICDECHGFGWNWRGGVEIDFLGELVSLQKFTPPIDKQHLQDYDLL